jgi:ferritin-like metal-binding protein YciE
MAETNERVRETITKYLGDMHALESHGLQAISRQVDQLEDEGHPEAQQATQEFKHTLASHLAALEGRLKALGGSPTGPVKEAASALAGMVAGLYNAVRTEEASKSIRDDYTFLSNTAIAYLMLGTTARSLGDHDTEELAEQGYRDMARLIMLIDRIMPGLVVRELQQDGLPAQDVADWAQRIVRDAWAQEGAAAGLAA